jgi:hypothetical protein
MSWGFPFNTLRIKSSLYFIHVSVEVYNLRSSLPIETLIKPDEHYSQQK